jgi:hypothetical protein
MEWPIKGRVLGYENYRKNFMFPHTNTIKTPQEKPTSCRKTLDMDLTSVTIAPPFKNSAIDLSAFQGLNRSLAPKKAPLTSQTKNLN